MEEQPHGLTSVLNGLCEPTEAIFETPVANLEVMPSGEIPANPAEALTLPEMGELLRHLRLKYDYIFLDTPPLLVVTDPSVTAILADAVILALRIRRKSKPNARESVGILRSLNANLIGVIVNNSDDAAASDGYKGEGYYRYGKYTDRYQRMKRQSSPIVVKGSGDRAWRRQDETEASEPTVGSGA